MPKAKKPAKKRAPRRRTVLRVRVPVRLAVQAAAAAPVRFFKDSAALATAPLAPDVPLVVAKRDPVMQRLTAAYNRLGGLAAALAAETATPPDSLLAVWYVESGGRLHRPGKALIRFENHLFYRHWGAKHQETYNQHFCHGGHAGHDGKPWTNHRFREHPGASFEDAHASQDCEYRTLQIATRLAGAEIALRCISIGGPQILVSAFALLGYGSPAEMYQAFQNSERAHLLGFFDFCNHKPAPQHGDLIRYMRDQDWASFARYYNGSGQVSAYKQRLQTAFDACQRLLCHPVR